jgi:mono/diheme cytochrome c family protein
MVKGIVLGILMGFVLIFLGAYYYFSTGRAPVAVTAPEMPFERQFARMALHSYMDKQPHLNPAVPADEKNFLEGAKIYKANCAVCHGLPGEPRTMIADGMFPKPPQLFKGVGVTDDEAWETYWKVANGIRMTGMPGFKDRLGETNLWQVSVLLKEADKLPASVKTELSSSMVVQPGLVSPGDASKPDTSERDHIH